MESVRRISFREKREGRPASSSHFAVWSEGSDTPGIVERAGGYNRAWGQSYFKQDACNYCDDIFAELADAVFMDAWLPGFHEDPRGTSIVMTRSELCHEVLQAGIAAGALHLEPLDVREAIRSQAGCLKTKREGAALQLSNHDGCDLEYHPRVQPAPKWRFVARFRKAAENRRMAAARMAFERQRASGAGLIVFEGEFRTATRSDNFKLNLFALLALPSRVMRKAFRLGKDLTDRLARH